MRMSLLPGALVALILIGANASAQSETASPPQAPAKSGQNSSRGPNVKGRAVYEDTGQPAARQRVQLVAIELLANRRGPYRISTTITDANGEFTFAHPPAGEYYVVSYPADAHVPSAESSPFPLQTGDPAADAAKLEQYKKDFPRITVSGDNPVEINLRVKNHHFGSISGRIVSADGTPVASAHVHLLKTGEGGFGYSLIADRDGAYHIRGLPTGEYVVSAAPGDKEPGTQGPRTMQGVLGNTYYPSTIDPGLSPPVAVSPDLDVSDINITLAPLSLHRVAGTVRGEGDGHPIAGATVRLNKKGGDPTGIDQAMANYFSVTDAQGRWVVNNLPDGEYTIDVRPTGVLAEKLERFVNKRQDITVGGSDVENLAIEVSLGGRVSGHVTVEQSNEPAPSISIGIGSAITQVEANGEFTVTGVPEGEFPLSVMIRPPNVFYAKSIQVDGADLLCEKLKTRTGTEIKDVRIAIAPASILTGRVLSASGRTPLSRVSVMLIPTDPSGAPAFSRPNGSTNAQGIFTVSGAPGEYFLVLWSLGEVPPHDVDSLRKSSPNTMRVTLGPGERKSMDLIK